jgi:hypothetical protein
MIHWKISVLSVALGAAATVGFVWLGRRPKKLERSGVSPALEREAFDEEEAARADAFHDFGLADREADRREGAEEIVDLTDALEMESLDIESMEIESVGVEPGSAELEIGPLDEEPLSDGERYDAVDPESLGNEFLSRAIEAPPASPPVREAFAPAPQDEETARIEQLDMAAELPVGSIDAHGNVELHAPSPTTQQPVDLSPTEEELERRRAAKGAIGTDERHE